MPMIEYITMVTFTARNSPDRTPEAIAETGRRLKAVNEQIEALETRWLELSTRIDALAETAA